MDDWDDLIQILVDAAPPLPDEVRLRIGQILRSVDISAEGAGPGGGAGTGPAPTGPSNPPQGRALTAGAGAGARHSSKVLAEVRLAISERKRARQSPESEARPALAGEPR